MRYEEKLEVLGMTTLEDRRKRGDQIEQYKIMSDKSVLNKTELYTFVRERHNIDTRNSSQDLLVPEKCRLNVRKDFFMCRVINDWNNLPEHVRKSTTVNEFKNNYDDHLASFTNTTII